MLDRRRFIGSALCAPALLLPESAQSFYHGSSAQHLTINLVQDSGVSGAPVGFWPAVLAAVADFQSRVFSSAVIELHVDWGKVNGQAIGGISSSDYSLVINTYAQVKAALIGNAKSVGALQAVSTLPASAPGGVTTMVLTGAQQNILGLANNTSNYAYIGFATGTNWSFSGTPGAGQVDFKGICLHEITEALGRLSFEGSIVGAGNYSVLDLYTYSANGARNLTATGTRYFSIDSGATNQRSLGSGDLGDWSGGGLYSGQASPFNGSALTGQLLPLLPCDTLLIDALGMSSQ